MPDNEKEFSSNSLAIDFVIARSRGVSPRQFLRECMVNIIFIYLSYQLLYYY